MSGHLSHPKYRADIDGLRAIAVFAVVAFHAFPEYVRGGFVGVDIFFVISGFLISSIIFENLKKGTFSFKEFYARRIKRIFPALITVLIAVYTFGWFSLFSSEYRSLGQHIFGGAFFISNFILWDESGYFDPSSETKPLLHLWSLGIEEQFYIFWPFFAWLLYRFKKIILPTIVVLITASFAFNIYYIYSQNPDAAFYAPQARFWELFIGALLAYCKVKSVGLEIIKNKNHLSFLGITLILAAVVFITKKHDFPSWLALLPTLGAALIISSNSDAWFNKTILSNKIMVWFGLISYPLYLWHWPLLSFGRIIAAETPPSWVRIIMVLISILLAWLTYKFIEKPIRFGNNTKYRTGELINGILTIGLIGFVTGTEGFPTRDVNKNALVYDNTYYKIDKANIMDQCGIPKKDSILFNLCLQDSRESPKFALIGDSKALALYNGVFSTSKNNGRWLIIAGNLGNKGATIPILSKNEIYKRYNVQGSIALNGVSQNPNIETVVLATATRALFLLENRYTIEDLGSNPNYQAALEGLGAAVDLLVKSGKKVVLLVDNPTLPDPLDCMIRDTGWNFINIIIKRPQNPRCKIELSRHLELSKKYRDLLTEIASKNPDKIKIFDTMPYLCDIKNNICPISKNGYLLYNYDDHISDYAAKLIGKELNEFLLEF